jgi:hypothetical protein
MACCHQRQYGSPPQKSSPEQNNSIRTHTSFQLRQRSKPLSLSVSLLLIARCPSGTLAFGGYVRSRGFIFVLLKGIPCCTRTINSSRGLHERQNSLQRCNIIIELRHRFIPQRLQLLQPSNRGRLVLSSKASAMPLAYNYRADECRRSVDFSTVTSQVSYFDFATGDWTLVWWSVLIHVFRECGVLSEDSSVLASWVLTSSKMEAIVGCRLTRSFGGIEVRCVCCSAK